MSKQSKGNNFSLLTVDPSIEDETSTRKSQSSSFVNLPSSLTPQQDVLKSVQSILRLDKTKLSDQLNSMIDNFKKILHQLSNVGQVRKENVEFYCEWMRMIKHLCIGGGDRVSFRLGNETDVIPWLLYIAFDANVVNEQFIDGEIVRLVCTTIYSLIDNVDENRIIVRESRGLKNFLDLIRTNTQSFSVNSECKRCALLVLEKFCLNSSNKSLFPIINGTQIVIDQMNNSFNAIMNSPKQQIDMVLYGIIEACVRVLRSLCLNHHKNSEDISTKTPIAPLILCILNSLNISMTGKNEKTTSSSEGYKTLKVQDNDFSELLSHILFLLLSVSQKENRKMELINVHSTLKEENQFLELLLSLVCYLYSSSSSSGSNYTRKAFNQTLSILANLSSIEKVRRELISQKEGKTSSSKYFNYYLDKKYLNGAQVIHVQFTRFGTLKTSQSIEEQEERSFAESVLSLFTHIGEYNFKDLYLFIGMNVQDVLNHVYTIINHTNDIIILQHCLHLIKMYLSQDTRSIVEGVTNEHLKKAAECILSILSREFIINQSFTSTLHLKSQYHSDVELAKLQYSCLTTFNSLNLQDLTIWKALIEKAQKSIPYHRLCDWIIQIELVEKNSRVLLAILEILNQMVQYEKVDIRDVSLLGIGSKVIKLLEQEMFQDITIYLIYSLSLDSIFKQTFIFGGGLKKLFKLAKTNETTFLNNVLKIFNNFSRKDRTAKLAIAETGCLDYILNRFSNDSTYTSKNIKNTVALMQSLSEVPTLAAFIASYDLVPNLVKLLTSSESCAILEQATNLIFSVITVAKYEQGRKRVVEHIKEFVPFLHCEIPEAQENVINIFSNLASIPQYQNALKEAGLVTELENLVEGDDHYLSLLSQLALNNIYGKKGREESLKNQLLTAVNKPEDFKLKKEAIEKQYVKKYENEIKRESVMWNSLSSNLNGNAFEKLNIEINWNFFDELNSEGEKRRAFHLLKESCWRNLRESISLFCNQSPIHNRTFLTCVNILVVEFDMNSYLAYKPSLGHMNADFAEVPMSARSNRKTCATLKNISKSETIAETYRRKYNKLGVLFYNIGYDDMNTMSKEDFVGGLNRLLQDDISKIREITPKSVLESDSLKIRPFKKEQPKEADQKSHTRNNSLNDLGLSPMNLSDDQLLIAKNPMLFLKEQARQTYKGSLYLNSFSTLIKTKYFTQFTEEDEKAFSFCFDKIKAIEETFIKGWKVVKYNKSGLKQERFILLTDKNYYTIKYDYTKKQVDTKHTKPHDLSNIHVIDIGCFEKTSSPCLVVYSKDKTSKKKASFAKTAKKSFKLSSTHDLSLAVLDDTFDKNRPSTVDCYCNIFCGLNESNSSTSVSSNTPSSAPSASDLLSFNMLSNQVQIDEANKTILEEIAWSIYASACCLRGQQLFEPCLEQIIDRPKQGITSFIYNKLGFGNLK